MASTVQTHGLSVALDGHPILHQIDLEFPTGRVHGVLGPNGSGKTTLIRALCGAVPASAGSALLDGVPVGSLSAAAIARKLAVVWQGARPTHGLTVRRLVGYGRYAHRRWWQTSAGSDARVIAEAMRRTGVDMLADRQVDELSGGERQRVWLAMALAQEPSVLLLDEPTTYLDIAHQIDIMNLVRQLNAEQSLTVIMVLHDLTQAVRYCDNCVVLRDGMVTAQGSPEVALSPASVEENFEVEAWFARDPQTGQPLLQPRRRVQAGQLQTIAPQPAKPQPMQPPSTAPQPLEQQPWELA